MNSRAFGQGILFEIEAFCLSGTSPTDKKVLSPWPLCLCGESKQVSALINKSYVLNNQN